MRGAQGFGEPGIYVSFEEEPQSIQSTAQQFGWNVAQLEEDNLLRIIAKDPYEIKDFAKTLSGEFYYTIRDLNAKRVVIDSITYYGMAMEDQHKLRAHIADLAKRLRRLGVTTFLISEVPEGSSASRFGMEEFVSDGVIQLHNLAIKDSRQRAIEVTKLRKTNHDMLMHPFSITDSGIVVFPQEQVFQD